ncbi:hypothetical protein FB468_2459 [Leucobacter komagatae]|uniref:Uncharacterized protein n=1 Tax=Leucobacter komagatae TaxID=55969 RepID=A0A542Y8K8_9MICO|nr:DUF4352 domain-containing protein [Leucobacter komagatae]TQL44402.1 hypothetical protein FB468_2459 [Leucobacter komagatae]
MTSARRRSRAVAAWGGGLLLLVLASLLLRAVPSDADSERPFVVTAAVGEAATARTFTVTVTDAGLADTLRAGDWEQPGNWLVVDLSVEGAGSDATSYLGRAAFVLGTGAGVGPGAESGRREYRASERFLSLVNGPLVTGVPQTGSIAFELPAGAAGQGAIEFAQHGDTRLDSLVSVALDLDELQRVPEREVRETGWGSE